MPGDSFKADLRLNLSRFPPGELSEPQWSYLHTAVVTLPSKKKKEKKKKKHCRCPISSVNPGVEILCCVFRPLAGADTEEAVTPP